MNSLRWSWDFAGSGRNALYYEKKAKKKNSFKWSNTRVKLSLLTVNGNRLGQQEFFPFIILFDKKNQIHLYMYMYMHTCTCTCMHVHAYMYMLRWWASKIMLCTIWPRLPVRLSWNNVIQLFCFQYKSLTFYCWTKTVLQHVPLSTQGDYCTLRISDLLTCFTQTAGFNPSLLFQIMCKNIPKSAMQRYTCTCNW